MKSAEYDAGYVRTWLLNYGYNYCPANKQTGDVMAPHEFMNADEDTPPIVAAIACAQENLQPLMDIVSSREVGDGGERRPAEADGKAGPWTDWAMRQPRCGHADYFEDETPQVNTTCRYDITAARNFASLGGLTCEQTDEVFRAASNNWNTKLDVKITVLPNSHYHKTTIYMIVVDLPNSVLADQVMGNDFCVDQLRGRYDRRQWPIDQAKATATHEFGHALGLEHVNNRVSVMNSWITPQAIASGGELTRADIAEAMRRGWELAPPEPEPQPPPNWIEGLHNVLTVEEPREILGHCRIVPDSVLRPYDGAVMIDGDIKLQMPEKEHVFVIERKLRS